ncbi:MAG: N-acetylmuramoyl-L-alanine amidase, partial [Phycisphaerales bacterium]|nr:N-acetylmuramoyl-L-alanine amidase [Phycisphaerales bacterium]
MTHRSSHDASRILGRKAWTPRTRIVWVSFAAAMTLVTGGLFVLGGRAAGPRTGRTVTPLASVNAAAGIESIFDTRAEIEPGRWDAIVIHDTGLPSGSPASIDATHRASGLAGLGYHFVIGNGVQMGDGEIHAGFRWIDQNPGAHVAGPAGSGWNQNSIGVALVGNGDRRPFTQTQTDRLAGLVAELARRLEIPADRIYLHSDIASVSSPGRYFPASVLDRVVDLIGR